MAMEESKRNYEDSYRAVFGEQNEAEIPPEEEIERRQKPVRTRKGKAKCVVCEKEGRRQSHERALCGKCFR